MKRHWFRLLLGGFVLYLTADFCISLTCFDVQDSVFSFSLQAAFLFGALITVFLLLYRRTTLIHQIVRGFVLQLEFWFLFILDSVIGITRSIVPFAEDNYAGGLVLVSFWLSFSAVSVIVILCTAVVKCIARICNR